MGTPQVVRAAADKKLTIELPDGERVSVRPKDVAALHPGESGASWYARADAALYQAKRAGRGGVARGS